MEKLMFFFIRFSIPLCALGIIIAKVTFAIKGQQELLNQYDLYVFCLIFIVSTIFSFKRKKTNINSNSRSY